MRRPLGVILLTTTCLAACALDEEAPELGEAALEVEQDLDGTFQQGTYQQGTYQQGTYQQGTYQQGSENEVWGINFAGWAGTSGFKLKNVAVVQGHLAAQWVNKTAVCGPMNTSPGRSCDWHTPGTATCVPGTTVRVRAGGCAANPAQRSMIRVCPGGKPCAPTAGLAFTDAPCVGTTNPEVSFTCPAEKRYFVMVGPRNAGFGTPAASFTYTMQTTPNAIYRPDLKDPDFVGATLDGKHDGGTIRYRVTAVETASSDTSFYTLVENNASGNPLCLGENKAIPFTGRWAADGTKWDATTTFTFGCTIGVIAKCYLHGYRPWAYSSGGEALDDYHQTCTRAARGDFCATGGSYTVNGTIIDLYDRLDHVPEADEPAMELEAIWRREPTGETPAPFAPACLSKKRWDTIPYAGGGACPNIQDPRVSPFGGVKYCDGVDADAWFVQSSTHLIATESAHYDTGLWQWRRDNDYRATAACTTADNSSSCVADGYEYAPLPPPAEGQPVFLGAIYRVDLDPDLRPHSRPLYSHRNTGGRYVTTTDESFAGYDAERTLEGYILDTSCEPDNCLDRPRLELFVGPYGYVTATSDPGPEYDSVKVLGYLPR